MEVEHQLETIKQWYDKAIALNRNQRKSKRKEEWLKERQRLLASRQEVPRQQITRPQVWPRRQEISQQQVVIGPIPIERVEKTNIIMIQPQQQRAGFTPCNSQAMDVDRRENQNCYNYGGFRHLARNCKNKGERVGQGRRLEYGENRPNNNLNGNKGLIGPNQISKVTTDLQYQLEQQRVQKHAILTRGTY